MQMHGATKIELDLLDLLRKNEAGPASVENTNCSAALSNAIEELQRLRGVVDRQEKALKEVDWEGVGTNDLIQANRDAMLCRPVAINEEKGNQ